MTMMNISELANAVGLDRANVIRKLKGKLTPIQQGNAKIYDSVLALPVLLMGSHGEDGQELYNYNAEKARATHHEANIKAMNEDLLSGETVKTEEVQEVWSLMTSNWKAKMLALPSNVVMELARTKEKASIMKILKTAINDTFVELISDSV